MINIIYESSNGLSMVKSEPLNWQRQHKYRDNTGPFFYSIYVRNMAGGHICNYIEEEQKLSIANMAYSSDDPPLHFKVDSIEKAGEIVKMFAEGMNIDLKGTIYESI